MHSSTEPPPRTTSPANASTACTFPIEAVVGMKTRQGKPMLRAA